MHLWHPPWLRPCNTGIYTISAQIILIQVELNTCNRHLYRLEMYQNLSSPVPNPRLHDMIGTIVYSFSGAIQSQKIYTVNPV